MLRREESHVEQMRTKEREYADLVDGLKGRIEELEKRLETMANERARLEEGELNELRERLEREECADGNVGTKLAAGKAQVGG
jgi:chaperonin cofactor prefoldin